MKKKMTTFIFLILLLEIFLWCMAYVYTQNKVIHEKTPSSSDAKGLRVLVLGESTSYPFQHSSLEGKAWPEITRDKLRENEITTTFYNMSYPAITTNEIYALLEDALETFKPHVTISMIGINDSNEWTASLSRSPLKKLKTYRLASWIYYEALRLIDIIYVSREGDLRDELNSKISEFGKVVTLSKKERKELINLYDQFFSQEYFPRERIGDYSWLLCEEQKIERCIDLFKYTHEKMIRLDHYMLMNAQCCLAGDPSLEKILSYNDYEMNYELRKDSFEYNLNLIDQLILEKGSYHIITAYPMRSTKEQERVLGESEMRVYINQKENFKKVLNNKKWEEVFTDQFAGDFGHPTPLGHELIADQILSSLIEIRRSLGP